MVNVKKVSGKYYILHVFGRFDMLHKINSNALVNITRRLIGSRQEFATVYPAIYRRKPDVRSNVANDWST